MLIFLKKNIAKPLGLLFIINILLLVHPSLSPGMSPGFYSHILKPGKIRGENSFKKGYAFYEKKDYKNAAEEFRLYAGNGGLLESYALYFEGLSLFRIHDYKNARYSLLKLLIYHPRFILYNNAVYYLASSEKKLGFLNDSLRHYRYILEHAGKSSSPDKLKPLIMLKISKVYISLKNYSMARNYLIGIYAGYPYFSKKNNIAVLIKRLPPGYDNMALTGKEEIDLARSLYFDGRYKDSLNILNSLQPEGKELNWARIIRLKILLKSKSAKFIPYLKSLAATGVINGPEDISLEARYYYEKGGKDRAFGLLKSAASRYGYLDGKELWIYRRLVWEKALYDIKYGYYSSAGKILENLIMVDDSILKGDARFLFWYGFVLEKLGLAKRASFYFGVAANSRRSMFSYYGIMSRNELNHTGKKEDPANQDQEKFSGGGIEKSLLILSAELKRNRSLYKSLRRFGAFSGMGLFYLKSLEMSDILRRVSLNEDGKKPALIFAVSYILEKSGNYAYGVGLANLLLHESFSSGDLPEVRRIIHGKDYLRLLFPHPYLKYAANYSSRYGIPMDLIYAVMRQESRYNQYCRSYANAIGLMQIIPPTGYYIAGKIGCDGFYPGMLYKKNINIDFGSYYLKSLLERFNNRKYLAIASYNAGPNAVAYWETRFGEARKLIFIESIPIYQTRDYVKKVLSNYYDYRETYGRNF